MKEFFGLLAFAAVAALGWLVWKMVDVSAIPPLDWIIGILGLLWLLTIVTVPWNIHFQAREVLTEADESRKHGIEVDEQNIAYTQAWVQRSLTMAVGLHIATALLMLWLAVSGVSFLGYFGAGAALLLTFARPIMRAYQYVRRRLTDIRSHISYPREDVVELRTKVNEIATNVDELLKRLDATNDYSWAFAQEQAQTRQSEELEELRILLDDLREANKLDHEKISRDAQNAMAQVMGDAAIVSHVREIVRFFKQA